MLTPTDRKLVQKYTLLPLLARDGLTSCAVMLVLTEALTAADSVFFHRRDAYRPGVILGFVLAVLVGAGAIVCLVAARRRSTDPAWLDLCDRTLRAGPFSPHAGPDLPPGTVAHWWEIPTPPVRAVTVGVVLLPAAVLLSVFLPRYGAGARQMEENKQLATAGLQSVAATLEEAGCTGVWYSDPYDQYADYGYYVSGYLSGGEDVFITPQDVKVSVLVDNRGQVAEIEYTVGVDIQQTPEENLDRARTRLEEATRVLQGIPIPDGAGDYFAPELLPDDFAEKMAAAYPYEEAYTWYDTDDGLTVSTDYCTDPEEEYGQYDSAYIRVRVSDPNAWE